MANIWYNSPKEGSTFAAFSVSDWTAVNTKLVFSELAFKKDDNFYHIFAYVTEPPKDLVNVDNKQWKFEPQLLTFKIAHTATYKKWSSKDKKQVDATQADVEKIYSGALSKLEEGKVYAGFMALESGTTSAMLATGKQPNGTDIAPDTLALFASMTYSFTLVDAPEQVKPDDLKLPAKSGGGNYGKPGETELEKLQDREKFIVDAVKKLHPDISTINSLADILQHSCWEEVDTKIIVDSYFRLVTGISLI